jgi:small conductance mechanosensitive channel
MDLPYTDKVLSIDFLVALIMLVVGIYVIRNLTKFIRKRMEKRELTPPLPYFISTFVRVALMVILVLSVLAKLSIPITPLLTILGAAGLAIGLALQGHLSNLAGGILILVFKPFKIGDRITSMNNTGTVTEIKTFFTILKTANKQTLYLPNGPLFSGVMINHTEEGISRVEYLLGVSYQADLDLTTEVIQAFLLAQEEVIKEEPIRVYVSDLLESSVQITVNFYVANEQFWDIRFAFLKRIKQVLDKHKIEIPYPQRVVHMKSGAKD